MSQHVFLTVDLSINITDYEYMIVHLVSITPLYTSFTNIRQWQNRYIISYMISYMITCMLIITPCLGIPPRWSCSPDTFSIFSQIFQNEKKSENNQKSRPNWKNGRQLEKKKIRVFPSETKFFGKKFSTLEMCVFFLV